VSGKPTVEELGIDPEAQAWRSSGAGDGAIEVAFVDGGAPGRAGEPGQPGVSGGAGVSGRPGEPADWVLMRVAGDPESRVLVFDRNEWECFLDGARNGEFDDAADAPSLVPLARPRVATLCGRTDDHVVRTGAFVLRFEHVELR